MNTSKSVSQPQKETVIKKEKVIQILLYFIFCLSFSYLLLAVIFWFNSSFLGFQYQEYKISEILRVLLPTAFFMACVLFIGSLVYNFVLKSLIKKVVLYLDMYFYEWVDSLDAETIFFLRDVVSSINYIGLLLLFVFLVLLLNKASIISITYIHVIVVIFLWILTALRFEYVNRKTINYHYTIFLKKFKTILNFRAEVTELSESSQKQNIVQTSNTTQETVIESFKYFILELEQELPLVVKLTPNIDYILSYLSYVIETYTGEKYVIYPIIVRLEQIAEILSDDSVKYIDVLKKLTKLYEYMKNEFKGIYLVDIVPQRNLFRKASIYVKEHKKSIINTVSASVILFIVQHLINSLGIL